MEPMIEIQTPDSTKLDDIQPLLYANGFICGHSMTDAFIVLQTNSLVVGKVHCSFEAIKTLHYALGLTIENLEKKLGRKLQTKYELEALFNGNNSE